MNNKVVLGRNIETIIGSKVAGKGVPYVIHFYGSQTLTAILPLFAEVYGERLDTITTGQSPLFTCLHRYHLVTT